MNFSFDRGNDARNQYLNNDLKQAFQRAPQSLPQRELGDINERYAEKVVREATSGRLSVDKLVNKIVEDMKRIKELSPEKVRRLILEKLKEAKDTILTEAVVRLYVFLVHGWDAAFGPKPKPSPKPVPKPTPDPKM